MIAITVITDMTATPTTFHAFESSEPEPAEIVEVAVLVAVGPVVVYVLAVEDVGCRSEVVVLLAVECEVDVLVLVPVSVVVGNNPLNPGSPPTSVLCDDEKVYV